MYLLLLLRISDIDMVRMLVADGDMGFEGGVSALEYLSNHRCALRVKNSISWHQQQA